MPFVPAQFRERYTAADATAYPEYFHDSYVSASVSIERQDDSRRALRALISFGHGVGDIAHKLGVTHVAVSRWLSATDPIALKRRRQIVDILHAIIEGRDLAIRHSDEDANPMLLVYRATVDAGRKIVEAELSDLEGATK